MMTPGEVAELQKRLMELAPIDRASVLATAMIEYEIGYSRQVNNLLSLTGLLAEHLDNREKVYIASRLIDIAFSLVQKWH
jgi:hypothetical protein